MIRAEFARSYQYKLREFGTKVYEQSVPHTIHNQNGQTQFQYKDLQTKSK